jgi:hypothetical protein
MKRWNPKHGKKDITLYWELETAARLAEEEK